MTGRPSAALELCLSPDLASLGAAQARLAAWLAPRQLPPSATHRIELVFEELAANIVMHGYPAGHALRDGIRARIALRPGIAEMVLEDDGIAFDPRGQAGPPLDAEDGEPRIGGLGLLLVWRFANAVEQARLEGRRNRLSIEIRLDDAGAGQRGLG